MNIFDAIRYLQNKPEGTELVAGEIKLIKGSGSVGLFGCGGLVLTELILACEHADFQPVVDWSKVPVDTKVLVSDEYGSFVAQRYFHSYLPDEEYPFRCFSGGANQWSADGYTSDWKYCKLAEVE